MKGPVLIVDDDEGIRESLEDILRDAGYEVASAVHGADALAWIRAAAVRPAVVLLDLMMPVMDGWQVLDALEREALVPRERVVVITAQRDARLPDGVEMIKKPMSAASVMAAIDRRL